MIPKPKVLPKKTIIENSDEIPERDSNTHGNISDLEKLLLNVKLKPISNSTAGYSKVATQIYRRSIRTGFQFNLMVVGCSGLGKSTFLNTLFQTQFPENNKTTSVTENTYKLIENDVELVLKLIEVPKFGDKVNNSNSWKKIEDYIDKCFEKQMNIESKINRTNRDLSEDFLVHVCLYFIQPRNDKSCLKELDVEFLKSIHHKVNVIPVISKADTMNPRELEIHKSNLLSELRSHEIDCFKFTVPEDSGWRLECNGSRSKEKKYIQSLIDRFPFAVVGGSDTIMNDKEQILIRSYPWGKIEIDNLMYSDTSAVRTLLLSTHMQELINHSHNVVYEEYRLDVLNKACEDLSITEDNSFYPMFYLEKYFKALDKSLTKKISEMESGFQDLVRKKEINLLKKAKEIEEQTTICTNELNQALYEFDKQFNQFIVEKTQWDCDNFEYHETYGTLRISRNGHLKPITKSKKLI